MADVFISYSRKNSPFARRLIEQLTLKGKDAWVDWEGIPLTAPNWWSEIKAGIEGADSFVFIMSPDSMASVVCNLELDYAIELQKRIIPVMYQEIESRDAFASIADFEPDDAMEERLAGKDALIIARDNWQRLSHINWVFFRDEDDFDVAFEQLIATVETDLEYVKAHTRYLTRADEWKKRGERIDLLLFGEEIDLAETWLVEAEKYVAEAQRTTGQKVEIVNPLPQDLQREYITTSRIAEQQRQRRLRNLRWASVIAALVGIAALVAFGFAAVGAQRASNESSTAQAQADIARTSESQAFSSQQTVQAEGQATLGVVNTQVADAIMTVTVAAIDQEITMGFANALLQQDNPSAQLAAMNSLVERYPQQALAYVSRGVMYSTRGEYEAALADYDQAFDLNPQFALTYYNRGNAYLLMGDYEAALDDYDQAIDLDPQQAGGYSNRGLVYLFMGDYEAALADFGRAIDLDPQFALAYNSRGDAYRSMGDYEAALDDYDQAIDLDPQFALAYNNRGFAYFVQGDYEAALADYNQALELNTQFAFAYNNRGKVYYSQGNLEAAIADYNRAIEIDPSLAFAYWNRGDALFDSGQMDAALSDYQEYERLTGQLEPQMSERIQQATATAENN